MNTNPAIESRCQLRLGVLTMSVAAALVATPAGADAGEGDDPISDSLLQQQWAEIDMYLLHSMESYRLGVLEQRQKTRRRTEEARYKTIWMTKEGQAFSRLVTDLLDDTERMRRRRTKLQEASEGAGRFVQFGAVLLPHRAKFLDLVMMTAFREEVREKMRQEVGPIAAADFAGHKLFNVVSPDGELDPPPDSLLTVSGPIDGNALFARVREAWSAVSADVRAERVPSPQRLASISSACDDWTRTALRAKDVPSPGAVNYVENLRRLTAAVESPGERPTVAAFLRDGGHAFKGGTSGDLLFHVLKNHLYPKAGTRGSLVIAEMTEAMTKIAKTEIEDLDRKLEELKRQNPAHNAVLRERMVPQYFADKSSAGVHAGLNSPAYRD